MESTQGPDHPLQPCEPTLDLLEEHPRTLLERLRKRGAVKPEPDLGGTMTVRELIRILTVLSEDEKDYGIVFEDKKYGLYVMSDELRIRHQPRIVSLLSRDDPPKE